MEWVNVQNGLQLLGTMKQLFYGLSDRWLHKSKAEQGHKPIHTLSPTFDMKKRHPNNEFLHEFTAFILNNLKNNKIEIQQLEKRFAMSRSKLHRKISASISTSVTQYIRIIRLSKACEKLRGEPEKSISEIAYDVGFTSLSYFTRRFKEMYGMSPSAWRNEVHN